MSSNNNNRPNTPWCPARLETLHKQYWKWRSRFFFFIFIELALLWVMVQLVVLRAGSMKVGIRAPEQCLLCQPLAHCVMPGKPPEAGLAPIDINIGGVWLLGLLELTGNSKTRLGKALQRLWTNVAYKAQSNIYLFIYLFEQLSK